MSTSEDAHVKLGKSLGSVRNKAKTHLTAHAHT